MQRITCPFKKECETTYVKTTKNVLEETSLARMAYISASPKWSSVALLYTMTKVKLGPHSDGNVCEFRSILGCSQWVQFYLCGFPRLLARY